MASKIDTTAPAPVTLVQEQIQANFAIASREITDLQASSLSVITVGGAGDGTPTGNTGTDDTAAINRALTLAAVSLVACMVLFQPGKCYMHSGQITMPPATNSVTISGYGSELRATDPTNQTFMIQSSNLSIYGLTLSSYNDGTKGAPHLLQTIGTSQIKNLYLKDMEIDGAIDMGMVIGNVDGFWIYDCRVHDTNADGIHITRSCTHGEVSRCTIWNTGDDNIAVVSNQSNGGYCSDILIAHNICEGNRQTLSNVGATANTVGRNIAVAGGKRIKVSTNICSGANQSGIMVCSDTNGTTYGCEDVTVEFNEIRGANIQGIAGHGDIFVVSIIGSSMPVLRTILRGNKTYDNVAGDSMIVGSGCTGTEFIDNEIFHPAGRGVYVGGTSADTKILRTTIIRATASGIYSDTLITGYLIITANFIEAANDGNSGTNYAIGVNTAAGLTTLSACDNKYRLGNALTLPFGFGTPIAINDISNNRQVA